MVDKLLLDFGAKFQQLFIISRVKLQNCHDNLPYVSVPRWWQSFKNVRNEDVRALKDALEKPEHTKEHIKSDSIRNFVAKV